jgi:hypothetical protein
VFDDALKHLAKRVVRRNFRRLMTRGAAKKP